MMARRSGTHLPSRHQPVSRVALVKWLQQSVIIEGKEALAEEFDVSVTTVERWIREGVPCENSPSSSEWLFHRGRVSRWRRTHHGKH
jgi:hypothetical protein